MSFQRIYQLKQSADSSAENIELLLEDYSHYVGSEQAGFIKSYMKALTLDFEMAMTRGENSQLEIIVEDLNVLMKQTERRIRKVKDKQNKA